MIAATAIRTARRAAGLTQQQLAGRLGVTQAAVARLESTSANPTLATLDRVLRATGHRAELRPVPLRPSIDVSLLREALSMTPAQRIVESERLFEEAEAIASAGELSRRVSRR